MTNKSNFFIEGLSSIYDEKVAAFAIGAIAISLFLCLLDFLSAKLFKTPSLLKVGYGGIKNN
jgi:hypothetical protein